MGKARKRSSASAKLRVAADVLADVEALRVKLENGEIVEFNLAAELSIPRDPDALLEAGRKAPAGVAFWGAQTERALDRVRGAEMKLEKEEGLQLLVWRKWYQEEECETPPQGTLRAHLDTDLKCRPFRVALRARRKEYGEVRAVRDAVVHRDRMVRMLIGKYEPT